MISIQKDSSPVTVMVIMETAAEDQQELLEIALANQATMAAQPGFLSAALHRGLDGTRLVQYLQWKSREDHAACMQSPDWNNATARRYMEFFQAGRARADTQIYDVVFTTEGESTA